MGIITYTWTITSLSCLPSAGALTDYVVVAGWTCVGADGAYMGRVSNNTIFTVDPNKQNYIPYEDLKELEVVAWVQDALGFDTVQLVYSKINTQIQGQETPTTSNPPLPWGRA